MGSKTGSPGSTRRSAPCCASSGRLDLRGAARLDALLDRARDLFAGVDVRDGELSIAAEADDWSELALAGFAAAAVARLHAEARGDEPAAGTARDALALLVRLSGAPEGAR
jgi:hypothetical protein